MVESRVGAVMAVVAVLAAGSLVVVLPGCDAGPPASCRSCVDASGGEMDGSLRPDAAASGDAEAGQDAGASDATARDTGVAAAVRIPIICRDGWGAEPPQGSFERHELARLTVHHSAVVLEDNRDAPQQTRAFQRHHHDLGWPDIAYHFVVDREGYIYEGRPVDAVGDTGTSYDPTGHFLVNAHGNFQEQRPSEAQLDSMARVLAWAAFEHGVPLDTLDGHRAYADTACPGDHLQTHLDTGGLRGRIDALRDGGALELRYVCGAEAERLVEAIEAGEG